MKGSSRPREGSGSAQVSGPTATLAAYIQERGLKQSRQRERIAQSFFAMGGHVTVEQLVARRHGFEVESHRLELYGRCARCRAPGRARAEARP